MQRAPFVMPAILVLLLHASVSPARAQTGWFDLPVPTAALASVEVPTDQGRASFTKVVRDLVNQYTLGFQPQRDGRSHEIKIQVPKQQYRIRARRSYTGPPPVP